jgi:hypothetical protein
VLDTLTTWMLKVPEASGLQPSGAEVGGEIDSVTPCGNGLAKATLARARRADVYFMFVPSESMQTVERVNSAASRYRGTYCPSHSEAEEGQQLDERQATNI